MPKATRPIPLPQHLAAVFMLARRLEQRENNAARVDAQLYRFEARCMTEELQSAPTDDALEALLEVFPATAEIYENLHYAQTGLSRSEPSAAMASLLLARKAIAKARRSSKSKQARR